MRTGNHFLAPQATSIGLYFLPVMHTKKGGLMHFFVWMQCREGGLCCGEREKAVFCVNTTTLHLQLLTLTQLTLDLTSDKARRQLDSVFTINKVENEMAYRQELHDLKVIEDERRIYLRQRDSVVTVVRGMIHVFYVADSCLDPR